MFDSQVFFFFKLSFSSYLVLEKDIQLLFMLSVHSQKYVVRRRFYYYILRSIYIFLSIMIELSSSSSCCVGWCVVDAFLMYFTAAVISCECAFYQFLLVFTCCHRNHHNSKMLFNSFLNDKCVCVFVCKMCVWIVDIN